MKDKLENFLEILYEKVPETVAGYTVVLGVVSSILYYKNGVDGIFQLVGVVFSLCCLFLVPTLWISFFAPKGKLPVIAGYTTGGGISYSILLFFDRPIDYRYLSIYVVSIGVTMSLMASVYAFIFHRPTAIAAVKWRLSTLKKIFKK